MRLHRCVIATALLVCLWRTSPAHALSIAGPPQISSIEWMAADSELVVRGVVIGVKDVTSFRTRGYQTFTLRVDESLTGPRPNEVTVLVHKPAGGNRAPWAEAGTELLVFLADIRRTNTANIPADQAPWVLQSGWTPTSAIELDGPASTAPYNSSGIRVPPFDPPVKGITMRFRLVTDPEDLLGVAREQVQAFSQYSRAKRPERVSLSYWHPKPPGLFSDEEETLFELVAPACPALERQLRGWATSPDPKRRFNAAKGLGAFRSPENEQLLRIMLDDTGWPVEVGESKWRSKVGPAAVRAYHTLRSQWDLTDVRRPVTHPELEHQTLGFSHAAFAIGAAAAGVGCCT